MPDEAQIDQGPAAQRDAVSALLQGTPLVEDRDKGDADERAPANQDAPTDDPTPPRGSDEQLDEVSALLADPAKPESAHSEAKGQADGAKTLADLAESAGIKVEDIYKLSVPMRDGVEPMTLGALKDAATKAGDLETLSTEIEERRSTFENEMIRSRGELNAIVAMLPQIPPELVAKARDAHIENLEVERQALLSVKPEWADDKVYGQAQADILDAVADYGFSRTDLDLVIDHRLTKLLHDFAGMKKRIAAANAKAKEIRDKKPRGGQRVSEQTRRRSGRAAAAEKARTGTTGDKVAAVGNLLLGNG